MVSLSIKNFDVSLRLKQSIKMIPIIIKKQDPQSIVALSKREVQVMALLAEGLSKHKISERLSIKEPTVATHVRNIYHKLGVKNAAGAISKAYQCGILFLV